MSDQLTRLEYIKRECDAYDRYEPPNYPVEDMRWLIAEVERLRKENTDLREAISPARIGRNVDYYIAVAAKMREQQRRILPLRTKGA